MIYNNILFKNTLQGMGDKMNKKIIMVLFIINFFSVAAINMTYPLIPEMIIELGFPSFMFGIFFATLSIANFLFSPFWGGFSDLKGRKQVIMIGLLGYSISQILFGFSTSVISIITLRFIGGVFVAAYVIGAMSYLTDITPNENRAKYIAYYSAISTLGTSFGSLIGGLVGEWHYKYTFILQFIWIICVLICIQFLIKENLEEKRLSKELKLNSFKLNIKDFGFKTEIGVMLIAIMFISFSITNYSSTIAYYAEFVFGLTPSKIGALLSITGIISLVMNFFINPILLMRNSENRIFLLSALFAGISMLGAVFSKSIIQCVLCIMLYISFSSLNMPLQQSIISKINIENKGKILGVQNSARSIGMIAGSLFAGFVFDLNNKLPFLMCGVIFILVSIMLKGYHLYTNSKISKNLK